MHNRGGVTTDMIRERRIIAKQQLIKAIGKIFGEDDYPEGYDFDDIFATDHTQCKWGWWFYLTAKGAKNTIFRVAYSDRRNSYQVGIYPREAVYEFDGGEY